MKQRLLSFITAATLLAATAYSYAQCFIQFTNVCVPNGAHIGTAFFQGCQGVSPYSTHLYAAANWTWNHAYYFGGGSGWDHVDPVQVIGGCCGTAKAWDYCANSWAFFSNQCMTQNG